MKQAIVIDLDGTLCDSKHREHFARNREWNKFHSKLIEDEPNPDVCWFVQHLVKHANDISIIALTGRNEAFRNLTYDWLQKYNFPFDQVIMRPEGDFRPDHVLKIEMLKAHCHQTGLQILFVLDDRDKGVEEWRNSGYKCWQVRPGGY